MRNTKHTTVRYRRVGLVAWLGAAGVFCTGLAAVLACSSSTHHPAGAPGGRTPALAGDQRVVSTAELDEDVAADTAGVTDAESGDTEVDADVEPMREGRRRLSPSQRFKATDAHRQLRDDVLDALCPTLDPELDGYISLNLLVGFHTVTPGRDVLVEVSVAVGGLGAENLGARSPIKERVTDAFAPYLAGTRDLPHGGTEFIGRLRMRVDFAECRDETE